MIKVTEKLSDQAALIELGAELEPADLVYLEFPEVEKTKGLVIRGFDAWVIAAITAEYKGKVDWIGVVDPSVSKQVDECIVISCESPLFFAGELVTLTKLGLG